MENPRFKLARERALELLEKYDISEPIIPVFEIAQREGIKIAFFTPEDELEEMSGFLDRVEKIIYVNEEDAPTRQMFTVAHELGHYMLEHQGTDILFRYETPIDKDPQEMEANCFAANLLVPIEMINSAMAQYKLTKLDVDLLAQFFGVSIDVINYRLKALK